MINAPKLLLLDEPTSALDPAGRKELLDFLVTLRGRTTVFFSTHILSDVERVCDHVAVLDKGKVLSQSTMEELRARHGQQTIAVEVTDGAEQLAHRIAQAPWALSVRPGPGGEIMVGPPTLLLPNVEFLRSWRARALAWSAWTAPSSAWKTCSLS